MSFFIHSSNDLRILSFFWTECGNKEGHQCQSFHLCQKWKLIFGIIYLILLSSEDWADLRLNVFFFIITINIVYFINTNIWVRDTDGYRLTPTKQWKIYPVFTAFSPKNILWIDVAITVNLDIYLSRPWELKITTLDGWSGWPIWTVDCSGKESCCSLKSSRSNQFSGRLGL